MVTDLEKRAIPVIIALAGIGYVLSVVMTPTDFKNHWMIREDGFLESLTTLALFAGAVLCVYRWRTLRHSHSRRFLFCTASLAAILVFGAGEEISWGQRILGIESPEFFQTHNKQAETNLHNMIVGGASINRIVFSKLLGLGVIVYLLPLPWLFDRSERVRSLVNAHAIPLPRWHHVALAVSAVAIIETSRAPARGEITEFATATFALLILLNAKNGHIYQVAGTSESAADETADIADVIAYPAASRLEMREKKRAA
jgi:hypothetical protein